MAAFHLTLQGKAKYKPTKGMEERMHVIGPGEKPVYMCKKKEVPLLFNSFFYRCVGLWRYFHHKMDPPDMKSWNDINPDILQLMMSMEDHYSSNFSTGFVLIEYAKSIIRHQRAAMGAR